MRISENKMSKNKKKLELWKREKLDLKKRVEKSLQYKLKEHLNNKESEEIKSSVQFWIRELALLTYQIETGLIFSLFSGNKRRLEKRIRLDFNIPDSIPIAFKEKPRKKTEHSHYDILLIEDDYATVRLLTHYFKNNRYNCQGVITGAKALKELEWNIPKVIILDTLLPDYHGYDLCKTIKSNPKTKHIPVYLFPHIDEIIYVKKNIERVKADGIITKPFDFSDFDVILDLLK